MFGDSSKYMGCATDPGEWWCDKDSTATDLGPGVKFSVRCGEDGGNGPYLICCYGLREDVNLPAVIREAERIVAEYQKPDKWHREGRKLQGPLHVPTLQKWESLEDILRQMADPKSRSLQQCKRANQAAGKMVWKFEHIVRDYTGYGPMARRVIELAGIEKIQAIYDACEVA